MVMQEHISIIIAFHPHHTSLLLPLVVGPGRPLRESRTVTGLLQKRKLAKKNKRENDKTYQKKKLPVPMLKVGVINGWYPNPNPVPRWVPCPLKD
jgi:hypothetical protein